MLTLSIHVTQTTVLDGRNGLPLVKPYIHSTTGTQASPLTVSATGVGNDLFLHWAVNCVGHEGQGTPYRFIDGEYTLLSIIVI